MSAHEILPVTDENDVQIGTVVRGELVYPQIYRVSALWLVDGAGSTLLAQRSHTKAVDPGLWGPAAAGTVPDGETYLDCMVREAEEELGLRRLVLAEGPKELYDTGAQRFWCSWFIAKTSQGTNITIEEGEVERVAWFPIEMVREALSDSPEMFVPNARENWATLLD